jgi:radical SAM protein with 4Fe4S-binding SPASM domain
LGEPTLHKQVVDLVAYAKKKRMYVYFNSNHTVTREEQMRGFVEHELDELRISMSAGTKESFLGYAGRDLFDQLLERARRMVEIRGDKKKPLLRAIFVLTAHNYQEFPLVVRNAEEIGLDELQVQALLDWGKEEHDEEGEAAADAPHRDQMSEVRDIVTKAASRATRIRVVLPEFLHGGAQESRAAGSCRWPFNAMWITSDGNATPCCNLHDPRQISLGDAFENRLEDIWLGRDYEDFRANYRANKVDACRSCPVHYGQFKTYTYSYEK